MAASGGLAASPRLSVGCQNPLEGFAGAGLLRCDKHGGRNQPAATDREGTKDELGRAWSLAGARADRRPIPFPEPSQRRGLAAQRALLRCRPA